MKALGNGARITGVLPSILFSFLIPLCGAAAAEAQRQQEKISSDTASGKGQSPSSKPARNAEDHVIINTDLISFNVTVTDNYGRFVSGLSKSAFSVFDEKEPQEIAYFSDEDAPASVAIVFDFSGSMNGEKIRRSKEALSHFLDTCHTEDEYFLIGFNNRARLLLDKTRDTQKILDKLTYVETKGQTAFYDAVYLGVHKVMRGTHQKRAVLVLSDGQDNDSRYTFSDLKNVLKESDVIVYSIGIESPRDGSLGMEGSGILDEISAVSGGKAFFPKGPSEMDDVFERIALELRHQYAIGYKPANFAANGKWHRIKIKVNSPRGLPRLSVRSKEGYYALTNPQ
jgi:Ca-activated chloride channel family protein